MVGVDTGAMRNHWDIVGRSQSYDSSSLCMCVMCMCVYVLCVCVYVLCVLCVCMCYVCVCVLGMVGYEKV